MVGSSEMTAVISEGREALGGEVQQRLQEYLENYVAGLRVVKVNLENSQPPSQVQAAFDDVIKAREDEQRLKNQAEAYSNGVIPEARGRAQRVLEEANAYREISKEEAAFQRRHAEAKEAIGSWHEQVVISWDADMRAEFDGIVRDACEAVMDDMMEAIGAIAAKATARGKLSAIYAINTAICATYAAMGYRLMAVATEGLYMAAGAAQMVAEAREAMDKG